jgi:aspartate aminotransferase-like enzyme
MKQAKLFTPGPTAVPAQVLEIQAQPLIHHRTDAFREAHREVMDGLRYILRTQNPVAVLTSSGTGAMEAAVVNLTHPGDKVLVTVNGKFSERWALIARAYGVETVEIEEEWGKAVTPDRVDRAFADNPGIAVMFTTHSETSTGVLQDVASFARIARDHRALVVVDGISSIGAHDVWTDRWGLDVVVGGGQKGVMIPPGLSYVALSQGAISKIKAGRQPCYYFDLLAAVDAAERGDTPYTPAITLVLALREALRLMRDEGIENVVARHAANAAAVRAAVTALGLDLLTRTPSNATTAVRPPEGTAPDIVRTMEQEYGVRIAGGQAKLKGKIVRLGHLGHYSTDDMHELIRAFENTLVDLGIAAETGAGLAALRGSYEGSDA